MASLDVQAVLDELVARLSALLWAGEPQDVRCPQCHRLLLQATPGSRVITVCPRCKTRVETRTLVVGEVQLET